MGVDFGKARRFIRLHEGNKAANCSMLHIIFLKFSLTALCSRELILWLFAPESKFCLSHRRAPAPLNCLTAWEFRGKMRTGFRRHNHTYLDSVMV